jgi:hypothetical protein
VRNLALLVALSRVGSVVMVSVREKAPSAERGAPPPADDLPPLPV